ncbi:MAG TPA: cytochrome c3 family protein [Pyrinomonadaceae bacterium]|jgi:cytochrome c553|nr:cytochrome c3 family protein [Pyrinomonadaceae bacterium]
MKRSLIGSIIILAAISLGIVGITVRTSASWSQQIPKESKDQPTKVKLDQDSLDDKWGEVAFDHETHSVRKYNPDGASVTPCTFCHHTDQPKDQLKPPLTTSERDVTLTADVLKDAAAKPVKTCRQCHLQAGDDSKKLPEITKDGKQVKMDNENAYHINCFECHDAAIKAKPELAQKISGSDPKGCGKCHVAK